MRAAIDDIDLRIHRAFHRVISHVDVALVLGDVEQIMSQRWTDSGLSPINPPGTSTEDPAQRVIGLDVLRERVRADLFGLRHPETPWEGQTGNLRLPWFDALLRQDQGEGPVHRRAQDPIQADAREASGGQN